MAATLNIGPQGDSIVPQLFEFLRNQEAAQETERPPPDHHDLPNRLSKSMILGYT
jgi:hypothetical protein